MKNNILNKKAQITVFIIIAIIIVVGIGLYFVLKGDLFQTKLPAELEPIYSYYLSCIEGDVGDGTLILGEQAGYIQQPEFSPGSTYMPFSSQLDFLGIGVPYWYYISGNGIVREQIPSKAKMQSQLNDFLEERLLECDFSQFEEKGFSISLGEAQVESVIDEINVEVNVEQDLSLSNGEITWSGESHNVEINSNLGKFYDLAKKIYENQKDSMFLERYGLDTLRLYAPVDGSEIGCAPKVWNVDDIRIELINALEANVPAVKLEGNYYDLRTKENEYFVQDIGEDVDVNVNFMYINEWPMKLEVWPSEDGILKAEPVGLEEGMGMLGFCYTPYHFVYDFAYPVMIQLYSGTEMFQFPVVVYIEKNNPREALNVEGLPDVVPELCLYKNTEMSVYTYNTNLESIEANIGFKCFDTTCNIGETEISGADAVLVDNFPQCVNGYILASAEGYETEKYLVSTVESDTAIIVLDKKYKLGLEVQKQGEEIGDDYAVINFVKDDKTITVAYPEQNEIELTEGQYEIKTYIYSDSEINLQGSKTQKCVDVPKSGISGIFGLTEEKCFDLEIPDQIVSFAVSGGGKQDYYIGESELQDSNKLIINAGSFGIPSKVEDLQLNYNSIEVSKLDIMFQ
tara:strand:+ start:3394 stop:5274 length:1881 start_codon:yes stop_codon:yes gene_type:complete